MNKERKILLLVCGTLLLVAGALLLTPWFLTGLVVVAWFGKDAFVSAANEMKEEVPLTREDRLNENSQKADWETEFTLEDVFSAMAGVEVKMAYNPVSEPLKLSVNSLVDAIRECLITLDDKGEKGVVRWRTSQIGTEFLPRLINRFLAIPGQDESTLIETLDPLTEKVLQLSNQAENDYKDDFESYNKAIQKITEKV